MRVIIAGATTWTDRDLIREQLAALPSDTVVVYGDAPGADAIAGEIAVELNFKTEPMVKNKEDYRRFGRVAWKGLNERMLATGIDLVVGFHPDVESSQGTKHMADIAKAADVTVKIITG